MYLEERDLSDWKSPNVTQIATDVLCQILYTFTPKDDMKPTYVILIHNFRLIIAANIMF